MFLDLMIDNNVDKNVMFISLITARANYLHYLNFSAVQMTKNVSESSVLTDSFCHDCVFFPPFLFKPHDFLKTFFFTVSQ